MEKIKEHINSCMKRYVTNYIRDDMHSRLDELFLLWSSINNITFVASVEEFGLNYPDFNNRNYNKVRNKIKEIFKEYFEEIEDGY